MDKERIVHELAIEAAKIEVDMNMPDYIHRGVEGCASDLLSAYLKAREVLILGLRNKD